MGIRALAIVGSLFILATMAIALAIYFRVIPVPASVLGVFARSAQPEFSARYYPPETLAYTWVTLAPSGRQTRFMSEILERLYDYPGFVRTLEEWKSDLAEETGIVFDEDVATWIGPEISAGVLDRDDEHAGPVVAVMIGVRDEDAAADFLDQWLEFTATEWNTEFDNSMFRGNPTWIAHPGDQAYALTNDWLVYTSDEAALHDIIDRIEGRGGESLAMTPEFEAARAALPAERFASAFLDSRRGPEILSGLFGEPSSFVLGDMGPWTRPDASAGFASVTATWVERGLVAEWIVPSAPTDALNVDNLEDPARLVPRDALAFFAATFDPDLDNWRAALADRSLSDVFGAPAAGAGLEGVVPGGLGGEAQQVEEDASLADVLDLALEMVKRATDIDLEAEFFANLGGTAILSVQNFDAHAIRQDPGGHPIEGVVMLSYPEGRREDLDATMRRMTDLVTTQTGLSAESADVGGDQPATVFDLEPLAAPKEGSTGYRPGYVLHDQYLTLGTTEQAIGVAVGLQNGQGESLPANPEYRRAIQYLPEVQQVTGYVDAHRIVGSLDGDTGFLEADEYEVLRDAVGVLAFGSNRQEDRIRSVVVLTLFPE